MITKSTILSIITALICCLTQISAQAEIYKWVGEDGQINYGDQPVSKSAEKVNIRTNETTKPRTVKKAENSSDKNAEKTTKEAAVPEMVEVEIPKSEKRQLCNEAKGDITAINSRGRMREINAKGEYIYLSEAERQQRLTTAKNKQRKYCR